MGERFFFIIIIGTNLFETFFGSIFTNLSSLSPIPLPIWKLLICCLSVFLLQLINWILFIAIYLAPSIYQFGDRTVSSNNIDCFQSVRQLNKIYVAKFGLKYVQTSVLIHRLNKFSCFVIVMFVWLFCAVSLWMFPKILCFYKWYIPFWHGDNRWKWDSSYSDKFCSRG